VFRKIVMKDKETLGILESSRTSPQSMLISVHRSRIIEVICTALYTLHLVTCPLIISLGSVAHFCQIVCFKISGIIYNNNNNHDNVYGAVIMT